MRVEVRTRAGWLPVDGDGPPPAVEEADRLELRGPDDAVWYRIGVVDLPSAGDGSLVVPWSGDQRFSGHVGMVELGVDGEVVGEIEIVPGKLNVEAYRRLRADLEATWVDLVFDPEGLGSISGDLPPPETLWAMVRQPLADIMAVPATAPAVVVQTRELRRVRRPGELTPSVLRASRKDKAGLARVQHHATDCPENQMAAEALRRLHHYARRRPDGGPVSEATARLLSRPPFAGPPRPVRTVTWTMRTDPRYRQVHRVHHLLQRPETGFTEGPGSLRKGVRSLGQLFEYWVFLQVLREAARVCGPPLAGGLAGIARPTTRGTTRLELAPGTTVEFPGGVTVAYEPDINSRGDGWQGVEYVPHPDVNRSRQLRATPDVVLLRRGHRPELRVVDAKYVARSMVELEASRLHEKYARMRLGGEPVVAAVTAVHPHVGFRNRWSGYGHVGLAPAALGGLVELVPARWAPARPLVVPAPGPAAGSQPGSGTVVVADQGWMREQLGSRRIDLDRLAVAAAGGAPVAKVIVMPELYALQGFERAVTVRGWRVVHHGVGNREQALALIGQAASAAVAAGHRVVVIGPADELLAVSGSRDRRSWSFWTALTAVVDDQRRLSEL